MKKYKNILSFLLAFVFTFTTVSSFSVDVFASRTDGKGDTSYTDKVVDDWDINKVPFAGPVDYSRAQMFYGGERADVTTSNLIPKVIGEYQIKNMRNDEIITSVGGEQAEATPVDNTGGSGNKKIPMLYVRVGDVLEFKDLSIPSGYTRAPNSNLDKCYMLQSSVPFFSATPVTPPINPSNFPSIKTTSSGGFLPTVTLTITEEMLGDTIFYYKTMDWMFFAKDQTIENGVYNPYSSNGGGDGLAGYGNWSENGNHFAFDADTKGKSFPGGTYSYFEALRINVVPATSTTPTPTPSSTPTPTPGTTPPPPPGEWLIYKLDAKTGAPISGVTFDIYNNKGQLIDSGTTDASGTYAPKIKDPDAAYTVIERATNPDYQLTEPTAQVVFIESGKKTTTYFRDFQKQTVTGHKVDATTGVGIGGVEFQITQVDGKGAWKSVVETDASGKFSWENVPDGTYTVHEVSTTTGYILDGTPQVVTVRNGMSPSLKFTNSKFPGLTITKVDKQTGATITAPATFHVEQINGTFTADVTTKGGIANLDKVPVGSYKITEISAPEGYVIDGAIGTIYLGAGESKQYIAYDLKKPVLTIAKIDAQTGKNIPGVKFEVKKTDGTVIGTVTTGADGKVTVGLSNSELGFLDPATYTITETFVPQPYVLPTDGSQIQNIQLNAGDTKSLLFGNLEMPTITVEKYDEQTGAKLSGAQFAIYEQADTSRPVTEGMTDVNGKFTSGYIKPGTYVVRELLPPIGYMFSDKTQSERVIVAKAGDGVITVKVDNILLPQITIKKVDAVTQLPLLGFTFKLQQTDDTSVQPSTGVTNAQGEIVIPGLKAGTYTITEIACPSNYILDSTPQTIKIVGGDRKTVLFQNTKFPTLVVTKTDFTTNKPVPNTTFRIDYENATGGVETVGTYKTNAEGRIVLPFVKVGWYVINETIPAQGMGMPTNPVRRIYLGAGVNSYTTTEQGNVGGTNSFTTSSGFDFPVVAGIVNYPLNSIVVKKVDGNTGEMLQGAVFEVSKITGQVSGQNGTVLGTLTIDASGVTVITGLEGGGYVIKEIKPPANYIAAESTQTVNLKADGTSVVETVFNNFPYGAIQITKIDAITRQPLPNAKFKVTTAAGSIVGNAATYTTDAQGQVLVENVAPGNYIVTEIQAPDNYSIDTLPQPVTVGTDGKTYITAFKDYPFGTLIIKKYNSVTKEPLPDAEFKVTTAKGDVIGTANGVFKTDEKGTIEILNLPKGVYTVQETKAPNGFILEQQTQTVDVDYSKTHVLDFYNKPMSSLQIIKIDSATKAPLKDAKFNVYKKNGELVGEFTTDGNGLIMIPNLDAGWYKISETKAPTGYLIDETAKDVELTSNQFLKVTFENKQLASLVIKKVDDKDGSPLIGAKFTVERQNGEHVGEFTSDADGTINIPTLTPDWYIVREKFPPKGYALDESPKTVQVKTNVPTIVTFANKKLTALEIIKLDEKSNEPLNGAVFSVFKQNGEFIGEFTTADKGIISIPNLQPDFYVVKEIKPPSGYVLNNIPQVLEVKTDIPTIVKFTNKKMTSLQIKKIDSLTGSPLPNAKFVVEKQNGEKLQTAENGTEWTTDAQGFINIPTLEPDFYVVREVKAPENYVLDETPKTVQVKSDSPTVVTFTNKALSGLKIVKLDSISKKPLANVEFNVTKINGEKVLNDLKSEIFKTDSNGQIYISSLADGLYSVRETKAMDGYIIDTEPKTVEVKGGKPTLLEVFNAPASGLLIVKTDAQTKKPLQGVKFEIKKVNGERVQSSLIDKNQSTTENNSPNKSTTPNGDISGVYTTDPNGRILINYLAIGEYNVTEIEPLKGYELDTSATLITV